MIAITNKGRLFKMKIVTALLTSTLVIGGLGAGTYAMTIDKQPAVEQIHVPSESVTVKTASSIISESEAKESALKAVKEGQVTKIYLEEELGEKKYEVEIVHQNTEYDVNVEALTGKVMKIDQDFRDDYDDDYTFQKTSPKLSIDEAKEKALAKVKGTVIEVSMDDDYNKFIYDIEIQTADYHEAEVSVDATTGEILTVEIDD